MRRFRSIKEIVPAVIPLLVLLMAVTGCSRHYDERLQHIAGIVSDNPQQALDSLASIDSDLLPERDRHFYDLLTIKAKDKAYITHTSDSLILDVIDYFDSNSGDPIYCEALYYGGRVYADMGDYPTALQYYQKALDNLTSGAETSDLRSRINSQMGLLLVELRLYDSAVIYCTEALNQAMLENDSLSIVYAQRSLGSVYHNLGTMEEEGPERTRYLNTADSLLTRALDVSVSLPKEFSEGVRVLLAEVRQAKGDLGAALALVRNTPDQVNPIIRNYALAVAADIYREARIMDTAYMYAHELVVNEDLYNKKAGYRIILLPEFRNRIHPDTLNRYYAEYKNILEAFFDDNRNEMSLIQEGRYNYDLQKRDKERARRSNERLRWTIAGVVVLSLVFIILLLYSKYRDKAKIVRMRDELDELENLKYRLKNGVGEKEEVLQQALAEGKMSLNTATALRKQLHDELTELYKQSGNIAVPEGIVNSAIYARILDNLAKHECIDDDMIDELQEVVLKVSPKFLSNLQILTQNKLTKQELRTALLIKSGFSSSEMTVLFARSNGAIISRKKTLGSKVLDSQESVTVISGIIRLL